MSSDLVSVEEKSSKQKIPHVLSVAGSNAGGGAGIQGDLKTCGARGVYCSTVITAVTAQNTIGVQGVNLCARGVRCGTNQVCTDGYAGVCLTCIQYADNYCYLWTLKKVGGVQITYQRLGLKGTLCNLCECIKRKSFVQGDSVFTATNHRGPST